MNELMQREQQREKRMAELFEKLPPEVQEKVICFAEGLKLASLTETRSAS